MAGEVNLGKKKKKRLFSVPESNPDTSLHLLISLDSSWLDYFSDFLCFWWLWQFWSILIKYFVGCLSIWMCLMFFLGLDCSYVFERHTGKYNCSRSLWWLHIIFTIHHYGYWPDRLAEVVCVRCLHCKVTRTPTSSPDRTTLRSPHKRTTLYVPLNISCACQWCILFGELCL